MQENLLSHGQGVFLFHSSSHSCKFNVWDRHMTDGFSVECSLTHSKLFRGGKEVASMEGGITNHKGGYSWLSIDSQNHCIRHGFGEARLETQTSVYTMSHEHKEFLESLVSVELSENVIPLRLLKDPIVRSTPMLVADIDEITMDMIDAGDTLPKSNLSATGQRLYDCVSGKKFVLNDSSFRNFSKAIEHSIRTPGLWCYETLKKKATEFGKSNPEETYLRITLGENSGESPGVPYVMEVWPAGHYSPIHSHSSANAIIRVLHGSIHVSLYPFLSAGIEPFAEVDFKKDTITWISPTLNQTHQLKNITDSVCVTIQCYMYDEGDKKHYDYFDYLDADGKNQQYEPDSDMGFLEFKKLMKQEWNSASKWF
jgi:hypothetical protein